MGCAFARAAGKAPSHPAPPAQTEQEPPEEDESLKPKEYTLNPVQSAREIVAGNFYFKKGKYRAASHRYLEATRWDSGSTEAFLRLAEAQEKMKDFAARPRVLQEIPGPQPRPQERRRGPQEAGKAPPEVTDKIVVLSTCDSEEEAKRLAHHLVEQRLAACVNILPEPAASTAGKTKSKRPPSFLADQIPPRPFPRSPRRTGEGALLRSPRSNRPSHHGWFGTLPDVA